MGIQQEIKGAATTNIAKVDINGSLQATGPSDSTKAGFQSIAFEKDAGSITGSRAMLIPDVSHNLRLSVGLDTPTAMYNFTPTTQNTGDFKHAFSTMTMTQSGGFLNINPALATVSGNYAYLQTWKHFSLQSESGLNEEFTGSISAMPPANQIFEAGLFLGTAGVVPADGAFFRLTASGLIGVISYSGVETATSVMVASMTPNTIGRFKICGCQESVEFWIDDVLGGKIMTPAGNAFPFLTIALPFCMQMRNAGTVTGGCTIKVGRVSGINLDLNSGKTWAEIMASQGNAYQGQEGDTMGSVSMYSNAALTAAAALQNAAAANFIGLGGVALVLPTLTAGTDGILFSYLNPVGSVTQPPKTLVVTGVAFDASVQVVLAGGPLSLVMGIAFGHTNISLATTESTTFATGTTKAPRRVPCGILSFVATAAAGTGVTIAPITFKSPIVVNPGEYFAITCRNVGVVTTSGALVMTALVDHYFE